MTTAVWGPPARIARALEDGAEAVWGAAVEGRPTSYFAVQRMTWYDAPRPAHTVLGRYLSEVVFPAVSARWDDARPLADPNIATPSGVVLYQDEAVVLVGGTLGGPYLHLAAWLRRSHTGGIWNSPLERPDLGDIVQVDINNIGRAMVLRHHAVCGQAGMAVCPLDPPAWYRRQHDTGGVWGPCWVTSTEWQPIEKERS